MNGKFTVVLGTATLQVEKKEQIEQKELDKTIHHSVWGHKSSVLTGTLTVGHLKLGPSFKKRASWKVMVPMDTTAKKEKKKNQTVKNMAKKKSPYHFELRSLIRAHTHTAAYHNKTIIVNEIDGFRLKAFQVLLQARQSNFFFGACVLFFEKKVRKKKNSLARAPPLQPRLEQ